MRSPNNSEMLDIRPVTDLAEAQSIGLIRNTGREFMTGNQREITQSEQWRWYRETYIPENKVGNIYAFIGRLGLIPAAYGLVMRKSGDYWLTGVIAPEARGNGHGRQLFADLGHFVLSGLAERVKLDVLESNDTARNLYNSLGYREITRDSGIITMELEADYVQKS